MDKTKWAGISTGIAVLASLMTALAANGEKTLAVLGAVPKVIGAWSSALPLGTSSVMLSLAFGVLLWVWLAAKLPREQSGTRSPWADHIAVISVPLLTVLQQTFISTGNGELVRALIVGGIFGFVAPWAGRIIHHVGAKALPKEEL